VNRSELHGVLLDSLAPGTVRAGKRLAGFDQDGDGVTARFEDGEEVRASVLVGADGIGSRVRELLLGPAPPRYAGYAQFQTWTDRVPDLLPEGTEQVVFGPASRAVLHHVGQGRLFWAGIIYGPEGASGASNGNGSNKRMLLDHFREWRGPIVQAIGATPAEEIHGLDVYDRPPVRTWGKGRVTLLGDAAHPMTTNLSQGGCQALEDAVVLARQLEAGAGDPEAALRSYERVRRPRTTGLVKRSKRVSTVGAWSSPLACGLRDRVLGKVLSGPGLKEHRTFVAATLA
jgi:2-polyprenyl-6-methoxyphenol hydroxylase-like FAD-dependent oxidoreductase